MLIALPTFSLSGSVPRTGEMVYAERLVRLRRLLKERGLAVLVTNATPNIRYLTGYRGADCVLIVRPHSIVLLTDGRYMEETSAAADALRQERVSARAHQGNGNLLAAVGTLLQGQRLVGAEEKALSHASWKALRRSLPAGSRLEAADGLVGALRRSKDAGERAAIKRAVAITENALVAFRRILRLGMSEREAARRLEDMLIQAGAEGSAFQCIVASGPNSSRPHHVPGTRRIRADDVVLVDCGACYRGYSGDLTRVFFMGRIQPSWERVYAAVLRAHAAAASRAGIAVRTAELDAESRRSLALEGLADKFVHGLGHGIGLEVHEAPALSAASKETLAAGDCFTVEPGVYLAGRFGIRLEDDYAVDDDGRLKRLSRLPQDLEWARLSQRRGR